MLTAENLCQPTNKTSSGFQNTDSRRCSQSPQQTQSSGERVFPEQFLHGRATHKPSQESEGVTQKLKRVTEKLSLVTHNLSTDSLSLENPRLSTRSHSCSLKRIRLRDRLIHRQFRNQRCTHKTESCHGQICRGYASEMTNWPKYLWTSVGWWIIAMLFALCVTVCLTILLHHVYRRSGLGNTSDCVHPLLDSQWARLVLVAVVSGLSLLLILKTKVVSKLFVLCLHSRRALAKPNLVVTYQRTRPECVSNCEQPVHSCNKASTPVSAAVSSLIGGAIRVPLFSSRVTVTVNRWAWLPFSKGLSDNKGAGPAFNTAVTGSGGAWLVWAAALYCLVGGASARSSTGGSTSSSTGYTYVTYYPNLTDGPITYTWVNYALWALSLLLVAWIFVSLFVIYVMTSCRDSRATAAEAVRVRSKMAEVERARREGEGRAGHGDGWQGRGPGPVGMQLIAVYNSTRQQNGVKKKSIQAW